MVLFRLVDRQRYNLSNCLPLEPFMMEKQINSHCNTSALTNKISLFSVVDSYWTWEVNTLGTLEQWLARMVLQPSVICLWF